MKLETGCYPSYSDHDDPQKPFQIPVNFRLKETVHGISHVQAVQEQVRMPHHERIHVLDKMNIASDASEFSL